MKNEIMSLAMILTLFGCHGYKNLTVDEFETMLAEDGTVQLVDVRTPEEYAEGHLDGAVNIDWREANFMDKAQALLDKGRPVMVYCRSGKRGAEAAAKLDGAYFKTYNLVGGILAWIEAGKHTTTREVERFSTPSGKPVSITLIKHASLEINYNGFSIQVDPVVEHGKHTDYAADFPKTDFILVTHEHPDHFDADAIDALTGESTVLITNCRCAGMQGYGTALSNGDSLALTADIHLKAVPAYNTTEEHLQYHPKGRDNGFVLDIDGLIIYIAGDTEDIPEMADLGHVDVAFLPVNQPFTMTVDQCIHAAEMVHPKVLIPYHFSQTDVISLPERLPGIDVRLRQMQ